MSDLPAPRVHAADPHDRPLPFGSYWLDWEGLVAREHLPSMTGVYRWLWGTDAPVGGAWVDFDLAGYYVHELQHGGADALTAEAHHAFGGQVEHLRFMSEIDPDFQQPRYVVVEQYQGPHELNGKLVTVHGSGIEKMDVPQDEGTANRMRYYIFQEHRTLTEARLQNQEDWNLEIALLAFNFFG